VILVDTSIWIDHLRQTDPHLAEALHATQVLIHPFIVGELACGNLGKRAEILRLLRSLPRAPTATDDEVLAFIEERKLMGAGIGYLDAHLLASTMLARTTLWTRDRRLQLVAARLALAYAAPPQG
jgi:predicted nucleic acid-binding protein